ncbi:MAG: hypothetical protein RIR51_1383 [Bacteroidota bacterium]|jgi:alpha-glucuronidase
MKKIILFLSLIFLFFNLKADDGYSLWLKFTPIENPEKYSQYCQSIGSNWPESPIILTAQKELSSGLKGMLGKIPKIQKTGSSILFDIDKNIRQDGFKIIEKEERIVISSSNEKGILYGSFELLKQIKLGKELEKLNLKSEPKIKFRMLNHWDNVLGTIERGYAGSSLWKWYELPENKDIRYTDYARANASIGINAVSVNNVNASARFLTKEYLEKVAALADVFRPYGIQVFLSINFASPKILGKLKTSDPLDPQVKAWWEQKAKEIYEQIPDFGGFLVKANSEGEPGPQEYGRTHADGANMLAKAVEPFGGIVIWRAFVYSPDPNGDRFKQAYDEFKPLDGEFKRNVIVQVKNGPIDFQSREPFSPLFGAMDHTPLAMEFQITQEYLGFSTNIVYQPNLYKEVLEADTYQKGKGSTVGKVIDGSIGNYDLTMMAGVANTGSDRNWTGHLMSQANWFGYGKLAWDHTISEEEIAREWIGLTFNQKKNVVETMEDILLRSRQIYVNFTTPLGLHHIMGQGIHFGPEPWLERSARPDWTSIYYHRADENGLGFNRLEDGSQAILQYHTEVQKEFSDPEKMDLNYLLWFHHIGWNQELRTGRTLWDELCYRYFKGVDEVKGLQEKWNSLEGMIDQEMFEDVKGRLAVQHREAENWRDACLLYFQTFSKQEIKYGKIERNLEELKELVRIYQLR